MSSTTLDTCPRCGEKLVPVLDPGHAARMAGNAGPDGSAPRPLLADPPVHLACASCPEPDQLR